MTHSTKLFSATKCRGRMAAVQGLFSLMTVLLLTVTMDANAQGATTPGGRGNNLDLEEVVVKGIKKSQELSLQIKRDSVGIVDAISSSEISSFPGLDIGEELQRLTGVTLDRNPGADGRGNIKVRGLPPDFTRTTINGQTVTTASDARQADFTVFPSELFGGAQIIKTPTASMVEGGIAATIDLQTPKPLNYKERVLTFNVEGQYHELDEQIDPRFAGLYSSIFADGKLGFMVGAAYDEGTLRLDRSNPWRFRTRSHDLDGDGVNEFVNVDNLLLPRNMVDLREDERLGLMAAIQYQASPDLLFTFEALYSDREETRQRNSIDGDLQPNPKALELTVIDNVVRAGLFANVTQRSEEIIRFQDDETLLLNFETDWHFSDDWNAFAKISRSDSSRSEDDFSFLVSGVGNFGYSTLADPRFVVFTSSIDALDPNSFFLNQARFRPEEIDDEETSGRLDISRAFGEGSFFRNLEAGVYASNREVTAIKWDGRITPPANTIPFTGDIVGTLPVDNLFSSFSGVPAGVVTNFLIPDPVNIFKNETFFPDGPGITNPPQDFRNSWSVEEKTYSGYVQTDFEFGKFVGNAGVRVARTELDARGFDIVGTNIVPNRFENSYNDVLPAVNFRYNVLDDTILRLAASRAIARPTLRDLSPRRSIATNQRRVTAGNPDLDPFEVNQIDFSAEWYFQEGGLLSATAFYKDVESFIITVVSFEPIVAQGTLVDDQGNSVDGEIFEFQRPTNGRGGSVKGIELNYQQPFTGLPAPFDGFGTILNYTYAKSTGSIFIDGEEVRTQLQNQPKESYNAIAYYETDRFNVRLTYAWVSKFLKTIRDGRRKEYQQDRGQLDFSARYNLSENIAITAEGLNLLDETFLSFDTDPSRPFEFDSTGIIFRLGAQFSF